MFGIAKIKLQETRKYIYFFVSNNANALKILSFFEKLIFAYKTQ